MHMLRTWCFKMEDGRYAELCVDKMMEEMELENSELCVDKMTEEMELDKRSRQRDDFVTRYI